MRTKSLVGAIVKGVGVVGMVGVVVVAPNAAQAFDMLARSYRKKSTKAYADYLRRSGYFEVRQKGDKFAIHLSEKGKKALAVTPFEEYEFSAPPKWDGRWHVLMFDIPETHRHVRKHIARRLANLGLRPIQDSVYIYPYDLAGLAQAIRQTYPQVARLTLSAELLHIDGQDQLEKAFGVKRR